MDILPDYLKKIEASVNDTGYSKPQLTVLPYVPDGTPATPQPLPNATPGMGTLTPLNGATPPPAPPAPAVLGTQPQATGIPAEAPQASGTAQPANNYGVTNNSALINQMYQQQLTASVSAIKSAIVESKNALQYNQGLAESKTAQQKNSIDANYQIGLNKFNSMIEDAPGKYQPLRNESEVQRYQGLRTLEEAIANRGDRGGLGRQELLMSDLGGQNRLNSINLAQAGEIKDANRGIADLGVERARDISAAELELQRVINQTNRDVAMLESKGMFEEARAVSEIGAQKISAIINETNRVDSTIYDRGRDAKADSRYDDETAYNRAEDEEDDNRYDSEWKYKTDQDAKAAAADEQARADNVAASMGIIPNPTAGVTVPDNIRQQLAPYAGDYQAFINSTTDPELKKWANVLRNEKIYGNLNQFGQYGTQTRDAVENDRDFEEDVRRFDVNTDLDMAKITLAEAEAKINEEIARGNLTVDQGRLALQQAEFDWDTSTLNPSNQPKSGGAEEGDFDVQSAIEADLAELPANDAYLELLNNAQDYIKDIGIVAYNKLLAEYKKAVGQ